MTILKDFEKIALPGFAEDRQTPIVQNQELHAREAGEGVEEPQHATLKPSALVNNLLRGHT